MTEEKWNKMIEEGKIRLEDIKSEITEAASAGELIDLKIQEIYQLGFEHGKNYSSLNRLSQPLSQPKDNTPKIITKPLERGTVTLQSLTKK